MAQIILDSNNNLIQGDFDNATLNNRTKLQTTTTNATTNVYVVPNGSSTSAGVSVANNSSLTNASKIVMATNGSTDTQIISGVNGSGTYLPLSFYTNNTLAMQITTGGIISAAGGGIKFPATQIPSADANTLDDYEEGTWTPQIAFAGVASSGATYSDQVGYYTKIGNTIQIQCLCTWTAKGSGTGIFGIVGLPFNAGGYCGLSFSPTGLSYTGIPTAQIDSGSTNIYFYQMNTSGTKSSLTNTGTNSTGEIILNAVYHV